MIDIKTAIEIVFGVMVVFGLVCWAVDVYKENKRVN